MPFPNALLLALARGDIKGDSSADISANILLSPEALRWMTVLDLRLVWQTQLS